MTRNYCDYYYSGGRETMVKCPDCGNTGIAGSKCTNCGATMPKKGDNDSDD